jgi:hypothetical protein
MAAVTGTVHSVHTLKSDYAQPVQIAEVLFTIAGTYASGDNGILTGVAALIAASRRNGGGTINMIGVAPSQAGSKESSPQTYMALKTVAISTNDVTFEVTDNSHTTEIADGAFPAQARPFGISVSFIET